VLARSVGEEPTIVLMHGFPDAPARVAEHILTVPTTCR
jgi:hypothetical protein